MTTDKLLNDREKTHGSFQETARIAQNIKSAMRDSRNWAALPKEKAEALEMMATKMSRLLSGDAGFQDHYDDIEGYAKLCRE